MLNASLIEMVQLTVTLDETTKAVYTDGENGEYILFMHASTLCEITFI